MSSNFILATPAFQGPLEALLNLIEGRKLSVSDISLAEVADAYLAYVEKLPELPLGETAQFILVASTLLLIKSRSLLPNVSLTDEESQSIEELERRLARYAIIRKAARALRKERGRAPLTFPKRAPARAIIFNPGESSVSSIKTAIQKLLATLPKPEKVIEAVVAPVLALEEVIERVRAKLSSAVRAKWSELVRSSNKHDTIVHFLAILELVRAGSLSATQAKLFDEIHLETEAVSAAPSYGN